ncbi:hypothetical protein Tco_0044848 [Tanacetum coccineum]
MTSEDFAKKDGGNDKSEKEVLSSMEQKAKARGASNVAELKDQGLYFEGATTNRQPRLDAGLDSGNIHESLLRSHEAPLHEGHTSGSAEDNLQLKELMVLVPKLVTRIANLRKS